VRTARFGLAILVIFLFRPAFADPTALEDHIAQEQRWKEAGLFILPHRPSYFMPLSYNGRPNMAPYPPGTAELEKFETKFQISLKVPVAETFFKYNMATYIAFTQVSFWQAYNSQDSSLFRNTDYEPEFFLQFNNPHALGPVTNRYSRLGYAHQSNGQGGTMSRSWNRLYAEFVFDYKNAFFSIKPWYRLTGDPANDSNPDLWKYLGYGEIRSALKLRKHELSLMFRNNLQTHDNKGAVELGWAFPLIRSMKGYVQYFNGYGESLLDYNTPVSRVSLGVSFSGWL